MKLKLKEDFKMNLARPFDESEEISLATQDKVYFLSQMLNFALILVFLSSVLLLIFSFISEQAVVIILGIFAILKAISVFNSVNRKFYNIAMNDVIMLLLALLPILLLKYF